MKRYLIVDGNVPKTQTKEKTLSKTMMKLVGALLVFALVGAACGSGDTTDAAAADDAETTTAAPVVEDDLPEEEDPPADEEIDEAEATETAVALTDMSWDEIVAQAQEEGEVSWFQWYFQDRFRPFVEDFEAEFGITVNIADGDFDANHSKLEAEVDREVGDIDVLSSTFIKMGTYDIDSLFMPLDQLPELGNLTTNFERVDTLNHGVAFWGNQSGIAYNTTRTDEADLPQSLEELEAFIAANPNSFGVNDPSAGGAGHSFVQALIQNLTGTGDYFDEELDQAKADGFEPAFAWLEEHQPTWTGGNADSLTRLNDGEFLLVPAWEDQLAGLQNEGELSADLSVYLPDFGMNGGKNSITIPANAENPAAALVFIDWLTSPETQSAINATFGAAPQHPSASDEFALIPNDQRANSRDWFSGPYGEFIRATVTERILGG